MSKASGQAKKSETTWCVAGAGVQALELASPAADLSPSLHAVQCGASYLTSRARCLCRDVGRVWDHMYKMCVRQGHVTYLSRDIVIQFYLLIHQTYLSSWDIQWDKNITNGFLPFSIMRRIYYSALHRWRQGEFFQSLLNLYFQKVCYSVRCQDGDWQAEEIGNWPRTSACYLAER